jgi:chromosome segregation ATPase
MEQEVHASEDASQPSSELRSIIRNVIHEYHDSERAKSEPAHKAELAEERKRRERLEQRLNELVEENRRAQARAEEAERAAAIRAEIQRLGVTKVDLAFRAVKEDISRAEDGRLVARGPQGERSVQDYLSEFVRENPEFLPARIPGGSGAGAGQRVTAASAPIDLEMIRPGMPAEQLEEVRRQIARIAMQSPQGS